MVLLDLGLPDVDGWEVAVRPRQQPGKQPIVVAISGLVKPVDPAALVSLLHGFAQTLDRPA